MYPNCLCKTAFTILFLLFISGEIASAQKQQPNTFGTISAADFDLSANKIIDSNTNAVIIANVGSVEFVGNKHYLSYVYKKSIRIKILNNKAYDLATIKIRLYGEDDEQDKMDNFHASSYNISNGKVVETKLLNSDIFIEKIRKGVIEKKFTMPDVTAGSIIEYTYSITSSRFYYLPDWDFQNLEYPCLYSEYKIGIPDLLRYSIIHYGPGSFFMDKTDQGYKTISVASGNLPVSVDMVIYNHLWIMKDIPAFKSEEYIGQPKDYVDRLELTLTKTSNGQDVNNFRTTWKVAEDELLGSDYFGVAIDPLRTINLIGTLNKICPPGGNALSDAKSIYSYVKDNFTCVPDNEIFINKLYDINKSHTGSVAELNMLVIALLRLKELHADPVILSTRDFGMHPVKYPELEKMNYVICMLRLGKDTIYLDASDPLLGFGKLPLSCYNGHAQIIDANHSGSLFFYTGNIREQSKTYVNIINNENGNGKSASYESTLGYFASYDLRDQVKKKGIGKYISDIKTAYGLDFEISNFTIDSLTVLENPVKIKYDINFKTDNDEDIVYFNPFINHGYKENPFKSGTRKYALEMPYPVDDVYELSMDIPKGYKVDELPKGAKLSFNETDGFFEYVIQKDQDKVQMRCHVKILPAIFAAEDYAPLRDFFAYVVKKESEQIVFKKN
ncbi:MAG: DUF3857 domain-containing protein [Ginsengibacter sp.]